MTSFPSLRRALLLVLLTTSAPLAIACGGTALDGTDPTTDAGIDGAPVDARATDADAAADAAPDADAADAAAESDAPPDVADAAALSISPASADFSTADAGTPGATKTFVISNRSGVATTIASIGLSGMDMSDFVITADTCTAQDLAPMGECSVTVQFEPTTYGSKVAALNLSATGAMGVAASLTGIGQDSVTLTVDDQGTGVGVVTGDRIDCGTVCTEQVARDATTPTVTLTATPDPASTFTGWSGGGCSGTAPCTVTMSAAETVTATFDARTDYGLTVNLAFVGPAAATVTSSPAGIDTSVAGTTTATFFAGTQVTLTLSNATPMIWIWSGACTGQGATCTFTMSGAATANVSVSAYNYAFVTSQSHSSDFGGQAGGDAFCNTLAGAANLPGHFQAWLSTSTAGAGSRLQATGAEGWIRPDALPFTDTLAALLTNRRVYYPLDVTEVGGAPMGIFVQTGTDGDGTYYPDESCSDWTSEGGQVTFGVSTDGSSNWTFNDNTDCGVLPIYCFGTDLNRPVVVPSVAGRRAFVSTATFNPADGLAAADSLCAREATAANLSGSFLAFLATTGSSAPSRFDATGTPWVRTDRIPLAPTVADIFTGNLDTALTVHADATTYSARFSTAWTGVGASGSGASIAVAGTDATTCTNWSSSTGDGSIGIVQQMNYTYAAGTTNASCSEAFQVYCFEQ